jgi:hypothetical protein
MEAVLTMKTNVLSDFISRITEWFRRPSKICERSSLLPRINQIQDIDLYLAFKRQNEDGWKHEK